MKENKLRFLRFMGNAMSLLSEHAALSEFISTHCVYRRSQKNSLSAPTALSEFNF